MKKGFTIIELLAVIIILAIIALIAMPIVLDVVNDAKDSAAKSEAAMIVIGINNYCASSAMKEQLNGTFDICKDGVAKEEVSTIVDLGNAKVNSITYDGKVTSLEVESNGRTVTYDGKNYIVGMVYYAFGKPTTSSSMNFQEVITQSGSNTFVKLEGEQLSVCIYRNNALECFKNDNFEEESVHLQNVFGSDKCNVSSNRVDCYDGLFNCDVYSGGYMFCRDSGISGLSCNVDADGSVRCN